MNSHKKYSETHPWINFSVNLEHVSPLFWMKLGEAASKCDHIAHVPMSTDFAREMHRLYLVKGVLGTTAIEGNTLNEEEVNRHLNGKLQLPPSKEYLKTEIDNLVAACNEISNSVFVGSEDVLDATLIKNFNKQVLQGLKLEEDVVPGALREHSVTVGRYRAAPAEDCEFLIDRMCQWLNSFNPTGYPVLAISLLKAILAHLYLAWIHPFGDGNGRTARLLEFYILLKGGVASPIPHLMSNYYNETRAEYFRQLDLASKNGGQPLPFLEYSLNGFVEGLKGQLSFIRGYQWRLAWRDYLRDYYSDKVKKADLRRHELLLELSNFQDPIPLNKIRLLTGKIADMYSKLVPKTLERDLEILKEEALVERKDGQIRVRSEIVLKFLPDRFLTDDAEEFDASFPNIVLPDD